MDFLSRCKRGNHDQVTRGMSEMVRIGKLEYHHDQPMNLEITISALDPNGAQDDHDEILASAKSPRRFLKVSSSCFLTNSETGT